jgi:magnesium chelatase family protein
MSRVLGAALVGVDGVPVEVEVRISSQLPRIDVVGLPEAAVRESGARVRAAIAGSGVAFPNRRVTVNLAPAGVRKGDTALDLPIAVGVLAAAGEVDPARLPGLCLLGELALDGRLRAVRGALALALAAAGSGCTRAIVPRGNGPEAALAPGIEILVADDLAAVLAFLRGGAPLAAARRADPPQPLLRGAPGCGKTMLARRMHGLLPALDVHEALEVTRIHGAAGQLRDGAPIVAERPFRAPHHTASPAGVLGGGSPPRPGEVSLAHRGVLFLDELPEFDRRTLESLRQVLEERRVVVSRARVSCVFPADFQLVAAANPCPCGWRGSGRRDCRCDDRAVARYAARVSGPLLDRIDLHVEVQPVPWQQMDAAVPAPTSRAVRSRVSAARRRQAARLPGLRANAEIPDGDLDRLVDATPEARALLGRAVERVALSARAARRVLKVARTIADLAGTARTGPDALAEALSYRERHPL